MIKQLQRYYTVFLFIGILICLTSHKTYCQGLYIKAGDKFFKEFKYSEAIKEYLKAIEIAPNDYHTHYQLGESYRLIHNYEPAEHHYHIVSNKALKQYPLAAFWYAKMMKIRGDFEHAAELYVKFLDMRYKGVEADLFNEKAQFELKGCEMAMLEMEKPIRDYRFEVLPVPLNTSHAEFAPVIFKHDTLLVVTSTREEALGGKDNTLGGSFSDQFVFESTGDKWINAPQENFTSLNSKFNESSGSFTADKKSYYFTRCDEKVKTSGYIDYNCAIYTSKFDGSKWSSAKKLNNNINPHGEWNAQPSISPTGDTLFFVSKRKGGKGMHDIWYSVSPTGKADQWGKATNMENINTAYIDMSPHFYAPDKVLIFSSNGREGFGGLDLYKASEQNFSIIESMGLPFNSSKDDFYMILGNHIGYLASNREGGLGHDDIYRFNIKSKESIIAHLNADSLTNTYAELYDDTTQINSISISGKVVDVETQSPVEDIKETLSDEQGKPIKTTQTNADGEFRFDNLPADQSYTLSVDEGGNEEKTVTKPSKILVKDLKVTPSPVVSSKALFENIYFDFDKFDLRPEAIKVLDELVKYSKENPEIQIEMNANTDNIGSGTYNQWLSKRRGEEAFNYLIEKGVNKSAIVINAKGPENPIASNENPIGRQLNRRIEFHLVGGKGYQSKNMTYVIEPKATLVSIAKRFDMSLEELKAINGIVDDQLLAYRPLRVRRIGDSDLIDPITMERGAVKNEKKTHKNDIKRLSEYNHYYADNQQEIPLKSGEAIYIVQTKNTVFRIALLFGMETEELMELNNLNSTLIYKGNPLKVKISAKKAEEGFHRVVKGDTEKSICNQYGISIHEFYTFNNFEGYKLQEGMYVQIKELPEDE